MEMASEMMDDALESTLDGDEVEDETNELVDQVGPQLAEQPQSLSLGVAAGLLDSGYQHWSWV